MNSFGHVSSSDFFKSFSWNGLLELKKFLGLSQNKLTNYKTIGTLKKNL